jgi:hypothetical protein
LFEQHGYLRLDQAVSRAQMRPVQRRVIDDLAQRGIDATGRGLPKTIRSLPVFQQIAKFSQFVSIPDLEAAIIPPGVEEMVRALGGTKVVSRQSQLLLSPPRQGQWRVEGLSWHTDVSAHGPRIPGVQAFVLIDDLAEHGGATLVLAGSHAQTKDAGTKSRVRDALHLGEAGMATLRELGLTIVELAGKAGDVYLMDMRTLHTPSVNTSSKIRVVATVRYFLK